MSNGHTFYVRKHIFCIKMHTNFNISSKETEFLTTTYSITYGLKPKCTFINFNKYAEININHRTYTWNLRTP